MCSLARSVLDAAAKVLPQFPYGWLRRVAASVGTHLEGSSSWRARHHLPPGPSASSMEISVP